MKRIKLGIIANEFFDISLGRMGGFGMAVRQVAQCFNTDDELAVDAVFIAGELREVDNQIEIISHNTRLLLRPKNKLKFIRQMWQENFDILLTMDYRLNYRPIFLALPFTPIIIWVHDPRTPYDMNRILTTRIPGQENVVPQGLQPVDCTSLAGVVRGSRWMRRPVLFATPATYLAEKVIGTYGVQPPEVTFLPNIIEHIVETEPQQIIKSEHPTVVFLARLDPYKRPWLFAELANYFPNVEFIFMGQPHFYGKGAWESNLLPDNVRLMGHIDGQEKIDILSSAWVLVNTSIHEGLAICFLEALVCETPILSCVDPENVVSRYGIYIGRWDESGREAMPRFVEGLTRLLGDRDLRTRLGKEGRKWVKETHNKSRFLEAFHQLCKKAGVR